MAANGVQFVAYDGNGNVAALVNATTERSPPITNTAPSVNSSAPPAQWPSQSVQLFHQILRWETGPVL